MEELKVLTKVGRDPEKSASGKLRPELMAMSASQDKPREDSTTTTLTSSREDPARDSKMAACNRDRDQRTDQEQNLSIRDNSRDNLRDQLQSKTRQEWRGRLAMLSSSGLIDLTSSMCSW